MVQESVLKSSFLASILRFSANLSHGDTLASWHSCDKRTLTWGKPGNVFKWSSSDLVVSRISLHLWIPNSARIPLGGFTPSQLKMLLYLSGHSVISFNYLIVSSSPPKSLNFIIGSTRNLVSISSAYCDYFYSAMNWEYEAYLRLLRDFSFSSVS